MCEYSATVGLTGGVIQGEGEGGAVVLGQRLGYRGICSGYIVGRGRSRVRAA